MTLNALFKAGDIACLISDHLVTGKKNRYLTRKSALISPELVVAASGDGQTAHILLQRICDRFSAVRVTRKALLNDFLGSITDLKGYSCTVIGWFVEGRKHPVSFRWNCKHPRSPDVNRPHFVEGSGSNFHDFIIPPFVPITEHEAATNALSYCAERTAVLWVNEILGGAPLRDRFGGGYDIYLYHPERKRFVYATDLGYLLFRLSYRLVNGTLNIHVQPRPEYLKTHWGAIRLMGGRLPPGAVSTVRFTPPTDDIDYSKEPLVESKMYACCFVVNDLRTGKPFVDVRTVIGKEAELFGFNVIAGPNSEVRFAQPYQPRSIINAMALEATKRAQQQGMLLA